MLRGAVFVLSECIGNEDEPTVVLQEMIPFLGTDQETRKLTFISGCTFKRDAKNSNSDFLKVELQVKIPAVCEQKDS